MVGGVIDVVIFTMEGREHLFLKTIKDLPRITGGLACRTILAVDGMVDVRVLSQARPDLIVMNATRRGYVASILNALRLVRTDVFLWIEDDWNIDGVRREDGSRLVETMRRDSRLVQVRWSKTPTLPEASSTIAEGIRESAVGFSANPNICRTQVVRAGFDYLAAIPHGGRSLGVDGFENVLSDWCVREGLICGVLDPRGEAAIRHNGELESTGREWHMTSSIREAPTGYGHLGASPPLWRRLWMIPKLAFAFTRIAVTQLLSDAQYDLAFRVIAAKRPLLDAKRSK